MPAHNSLISHGMNLSDVKILDIPSKKPASTGIFEKGENPDFVKFIEK